MVFARAWPPRAGVRCCLAAARRAASDFVRNGVRGKFLTTPKSTNRLTFEPRQRLHQPAEFRAVRQRGRRVIDAFFCLTVLANQKGLARLGLAISTRTSGTAVARNRIKRIARESFRLNQHRLPPIDVTVTAREAARAAAAKDLRVSLENLWNKIAAPMRGAGP